jgi:hypothetical protein
MRRPFTFAVIAFAIANIATVVLAQAQRAPRVTANPAVSGVFLSECMFDEGFGRWTSCHRGGGGP